MTEQAKAEQLSPGCDSDACMTSCYPLRRWWQPGWPASYPDLGLQPAVLELENLPQRRWPGGCSPWLGYYAAPSPLCVVGTAQNASTEQYKWRVILDMTHFAPSEISVSVQEGSLVIGGSHSERPDVFGITARCFTRKYRLPVGIDVSKLTSAMSVDGILCVEAPLPDTYPIPADVIIPIQVEKETIGGHEMQEDHKEATPETHTENGEPQPSEPTAPEQPPTEPEQPGTEAPDHGEEDSPRAGDDIKQEEEVPEEEVNGTPSGEPRPLAPADEEGTERSFPEPSEHSEALDSQDINTASSMEQQPGEPGKEETLETDAESRETQPTAPVLSDQQAAADHAEVSPLEDHGEEAAHPGRAAGDLQKHDEGTEKDAETQAEPHPAPTPAASDDGTAESLPHPPPPEHHEALDGQDSPAGTAAASAEPAAHDGEIQTGEEEEEAATEEITQQQQQQHEEPELVKGLPSDGLSQELLDLAAPDVKQ